MKNNDTYRKQCPRTEESLELVRSERSTGELELEFSLQRVSLGGQTFYAVASETCGVQQREIAAELIGSEEERAVFLYKRVVNGVVPPSTLHEIVSDLMDSAEYAVQE